MTSAALGEVMALAMFAGVFIVLMAGFPVAFSIGGISVLFAAVGSLLGAFDWPLMAGIAGRILGAVLSDTLVAVPLFIFMGVVLERSRIAEDLLITMGQAFGKLNGGLGISVVVVGALLAASTGIVGATVVSMGLISYPAMMRANYDKRLASGIITASGTLAQLLPPSTVLILIGTMLQNANTQASLAMGNFSATPVTVTDLFLGAILPGLVMVTVFVLFVVFVAVFRPQRCPAIEMSEHERATLGARMLRAMLPPLLLIVAVLGAILGGFATATESAAIGAIGASVLAVVRGNLNFRMLRDVCTGTLRLSVMIYVIMFGATIFSLVFRGFGGEQVAEDVLGALPGGAHGALVVTLLFMLALGFFIDTFEIIFIVVPIFAPVLIKLGVEPLWLGVLMATVLQTSYLTPPFGFAIFYLQGVTKDLPIGTIYRGVIPFVFLQLLVLVLVMAFPWLATWIPRASQ
ncbi:MAG: TRAP transporter large permease subunit [Burkholderiales bacterium]